MTKLPQVVLDAWENKTGAPVITTVDSNGMPNTIYATCVSFYNNEKLLVANNYFDKTLKNIENGSKGNFLFITEDKKAYQLKGTFTHYTEGPYFDDMKTWNPTRLPGCGCCCS